ncbi:hypothetical protein BGY98DRAFT_977433 [Russula aff. rugulosa BPL654]|nr:hypothetical protein BGY98DRAFT_977433 [Russula aff. rugulosa BPL654]
MIASVSIRHWCVFLFFSLFFCSLISLRPLRPALAFTWTAVHDASPNLSRSLSPALLSLSPLSWTTSQFAASILATPAFTQLA